MKITTKKYGSHMLVTLEENRLDASVVPMFKQQMQALINEGNTRMVLDISQLKFMDSSSLGAIVSVYKSVGSSGSLVIAGVNGVVDELFKLTRMDQIFTMAKTVEEANDHFAETA